MKKLLLSILMLTMAAGICYSQVKFNIQAGTGLTGITGNENYNARLGYRFGVGVEFPIDKTWSIQTGIQFLNRSYSFDETKSEVVITNEEKKALLGLNLDTKTNALYMHIPIKTGIYLPLNTSYGIQFSAGPYIAYGVGGKTQANWEIAYVQELEEGMTTNPNLNKYQKGYGDENTFGKEGLNRLDIGCSLGVDFKLKHWFAGISAEFGILPIDKDMPKDIFKYITGKDKSIGSSRNIGVELHIGYTF